MSQKKRSPFKAASDATLEDLKVVNIGGQLNDSYQFIIRVPRRMVTANVLNRPLVLTNSDNRYLSAVIKGTTSTSITELKKDTALLKLTVAEPYLKLVLKDLRKLEGAEIQLGAEENE